MSMNNITHIVVHYSATYPDQHIGVKELDAMHKKRGWKGVGYHYVIKRDGTVQKGRPDDEVGAHVANQNSGKLGICWIGGIDRASGSNVGVDNRTAAQTAALIKLIKDLLVKHPQAKVVGHRDLAATLCPGFDVIPWWHSVMHPGVPKPVAKPAREYTRDEIRDVQRMLLKHGYVQVGGIDGLVGDNTRGAVRDFRDKNELPPGSHIDDDLIIALKRPDAVRPVISPERANAKLKDLRKDGSKIVSGTDWQKIGSTVVVGGSAAGGIYEEVTEPKAGDILTDSSEQVGQVVEALGPFQSLFHLFMDWIWVPITVIAVIVGWKAFSIARARLQDHREGNTSVVNKPKQE